MNHKLEDIIYLTKSYIREVSEKIAGKWEAIMDSTNLTGLLKFIPGWKWVDGNKTKIGTIGSVVWFIIVTGIPHISAMLGYTITVQIPPDVSTWIQGAFLSLFGVGLADRNRKITEALKNVQVTIEQPK
jgi:hypothetical protein